MSLNTRIDWCVLEVMVSIVHKFQIKANTWVWMQLRKNSAVCVCKRWMGGCRNGWSDANRETCSAQYTHCPTLLDWGQTFQSLFLTRIKTQDHLRRAFPWQLALTARARSEQGMYDCGIPLFMTLKNMIFVIIRSCLASLDICVCNVLSWCERAFHAGLEKFHPEAGSHSGEWMEKGSTEWTEVHLIC